MELTGFSTGEVDLVLDGDTALATEDTADDYAAVAAAPAISQINDEWQLGPHRVLWATRGASGLLCVVSLKAEPPKWSWPTRRTMCGSSLW